MQTTIAQASTLRHMTVQDMAAQYLRGLFGDAELSVKAARGLAELGILTTEGERRAA